MNAGSKMLQKKKNHSVTTASIDLGLMCKRTKKALTFISTFIIKGLSYDSWSSSDDREDNEAVAITYWYFKATVMMIDSADWNDKHLRKQFVSFKNIEKHRFDEGSLRNFVKLDSEMKTWKLFHKFLWNSRHCKTSQGRTIFIIAILHLVYSL